MSSQEKQAYNEIYKLARKTNKQLKKLRENTNRNNPVDIDMIKTTKAMFYEECVSIFKKYKANEEE